MAVPSIGIVVATRNRLSALKLSLPLILEQSVSADEILVVDSSDDPEPVKAFIEELAQTRKAPIRYLFGPRGTTFQRNQGLAEVTTDIVIFPDDDSLFHPTAIETFHKAYAADIEADVVGVTLLESKENPLQPLGREAGYKRKSAGRIQDLLGRLYVMVETWFRPFTKIEVELASRHRVPPALEAMGCYSVASQEGFRMSYRTEAIRAVGGFNEALTHYALGEDVDASFAVSRLGVQVEVPARLICHYEFPGSRQGGRRRGVVEVLNTLYIVCRHTPPEHIARRSFYHWLRLLVVQVWLRRRDDYQSDRLEGIRTARTFVPALLGAAPEDLDGVYKHAMRMLLETG